MATKRFAAADCGKPRGDPSLANISVKTTQGGDSRYQLLSLPLYMAWRLRELLASRDWL